MGIWQAFRMAVKCIFSNKVRSFLTMLGVIIGVAAVITAIAFTVFIYLSYNLILHFIYCIFIHSVKN